MFASPDLICGRGCRLLRQGSRLPVISPGAGRGRGLVSCVFAAERKQYVLVGVVVDRHRIVSGQKDVLAADDCGRIADATAHRLAIHSR